MRTVTYKLDDLKKVAISIGRAEENEATRVQIDAGQLFAEYPAAVPAMKVVSPAGVTYSREVTRDGDMVVWDVVDSDLAAEGYGEMQLTFTENSVKVKSAIAQIRVCRSISGGTTPPDPVQDWLDEAEAALDAFPTGGTTGQVLAKKSNDDYDTEWVDQGAGGTTDYTDLTNKPQIGGVTLTGNKSLHDLGAAAESDIPDVSGFYTKPAGGIPASDIAAGVIPDPEDLIDDTAGAGDTDKTWSADKLTSDVLSAINSKQDAPLTAGTSGQVLGLDSNLDPVWQTPSGGGGDGDAEEWMKVNDFDSEVGGKVNTLLVPYSLSDLLNNSIILSNGNIRTEGSSSDYGKMVSPLISVEAGKTYGLKVSTEDGNDVGNIAYNLNNGYGLFASDGTSPVSRVSSSSLGNKIYLFTIPDGAKYIRFILDKNRSDDANNERVLVQFNKWIFLPDADNTIDDSFFVLGEKKENGEVKKIMRRDGSYLAIVDEEARGKASEIDSIPITFGRRTCAIFEKVCCIGDSFTEGYIYNSSGVANANPNYSWVKHLENMTGRDYVNCGISGATTKSWLTNTNGLAKAQLPANKAQAYIIALQINDVATELTVGTVADIGTSADSYYGYTSKIIDEIFTINNDAHVFLLTQPKNYTGEHTPYRTAILNIVDWYQTTGNGTHQSQVHLIDLLDYYKLFLNPGCSDSSANGHYTAVGWEYTAEILMYAWSNYLNAHPLLFQDVNLIPFGTGS